MRADLARARRRLGLAGTERQSPFARESTRVVEMDAGRPAQLRRVARVAQHAGHAEAPRSVDALPERVGKYSVVRRLARGRITEIVLARTEGIGGVERQVAIKFLRPQLAHGGRFVRSFLHEERVTSVLHHANVVQLLDSGHDDCGYYMVLEYIRGWDVGQILGAAARAGQRIPLSVAMAMIHGAAGGLHYLHELVRASGKQPRVSHRDVLPANLMVAESGVVKLIDFGNVAIEGMEREKLAIHSSTSVYTPPEAMCGDAVDRRGDVYSLGAMFYELTTGLAPRPDDGSAWLRPPSAVCSGYVPEVEDLVMRMLHPDPDGRIQSMASVQLAIEDLAARYRIQLVQRTAAQFVRGLFDAREPVARNVAPPARPAAAREGMPQQDPDWLGKTRIRIRSSR